ncbi:hypothetical protein F3K02_12605 [Hydrogenophaga sp. D2P1]|uniref:Uncharacterized protein n=1 Tax=Hydrogenophaga aromaticivorans TaxID=2610898 RepID=A0A7Y8GWC7_9BURK|nr:hypothetical protein [Hydrogenophaga aromaticivorans]NWF46086.1 hypothetical protein [Hydrogenophaga aromaticivorans]
MPPASGGAAVVGGRTRTPIEAPATTFAPITQYPARQALQTVPSLRLVQVGAHQQQPVGPLPPPVEVGVVVVGQYRLFKIVQQQQYPLRRKHTSATREEIIVVTMSRLYRMVPLVLCTVQLPIIVVAELVQMQQFSAIMEHYKSKATRVGCLMVVDEICQIEKKPALRAFLLVIRFNHRTP